MTQKHTPGPWFVPDQTWARNMTIEVDDGIACPGSGGAMSYSNTICTLEWRNTPEWDANACLIAAAPDMLEALEAAQVAIVSSMGVHGFPLDTDMGDALASIVSAIAKAEGSAQ